MPGLRRPWLTASRLPPFKGLLFILASMPLIRWVWLTATDGLGVNPVEFLTRSTGNWTLILLCVTLAVSPLRQWLDEPLLIRVRRMLGLFTFTYAVLHLLTWVIWDQWFDPVSMVRDLIQRPFILMGMLAWLILLALALTSTQAAMRGLGRNWQRLHRLVHVAGFLALLHLFWHKAGKNHYTDLVLFALVLGLLWGWRLLRVAGIRQQTSPRSSRGA
jgi:sulfoxide reductase heme-binding subunit YedZ